jgi:hypothetical protein
MPPAVHVNSPQRLLEVATELNARSRMTPGGLAPARTMQRRLVDPERPIVTKTERIRRSVAGQRSSTANAWSIRTMTPTSCT